MRKRQGVVHTLLFALLASGLAWGTAAVAGAEPGQAYAGAAAVDSTWHAGSSAGQYSSDGTITNGEDIDPYHHSTRREFSKGVQGREWVRALVVQGSDGERYAVVTNDLYIPQDLLNRRVAGILAEYDRLHPEAPTGITPENLTVSVSHSHSSPYYSSPSWGVWAFQDVFDIRFFEDLARDMAEAVIRASNAMVPVRMGAATFPFTVDGDPDSPAWVKKHSFGPAVADDGTPAGYPRWDTDRELSMVRFDDVSDPASPTPLANWVIWGLHPEDLEGNDLLASEYVNTTERILDRELGGVTLFSQNDTGTSESVDSSPGQVVTGTYPLPPHLRQEFSHRDYAQVDRLARILATGVTTAWRDVALGSSGQAVAPHHRVVPFSTDFGVGVKDVRFAPPGYRLLPSVSSCRTENTFEGNPGVPVAGLPDCEYAWNRLGQPSPGDGLPQNTSVTYDMLRDLCDDGIVAACVPDNTPGPSYTGLQETLQVHLQAIRLGDIGITICPCEQWADQSRNIKSRLDTVPGNLWYGWDYTANYTDPAWRPGVIYDGKTDPATGELLPGHGPITLNDWCIPNEDGTTWACKNPGNPRGDRMAPVSDYLFRRMKAQIYNDAAGWDDATNSFQAETEPYELDKVWGNFTHEELTEFGYDMVITVGMSNDYWGYIASYREFQRGDHYRKSLTGLGPHSMDFLATRLTRMAAELNGGPEVEAGPKDLAYTWDYEHQGARQEALGRAAGAYLPVYEAQMPQDGGTPGIQDQPADIERFDAARVSWTGGSNWTDIPHARVERCVVALTECDPGNDALWRPYA
ncbi:MAG: hypothetical protein M3135_00525, partial [Actinomycetota bacterium]|nr:hypothetical protein [Actinomycetota bacterium]